jgi:ferritin-like metal-binding protein YciE
MQWKVSLKEGSGVIEDTEAGTATRDVGIILASQKVEHYEIATYGGLAQLAETLGLTDDKEYAWSNIKRRKRSR